MSVIERYSPAKLDELTAMHPADARSAFAQLAVEEAESFERHRQWAQKSETEKAEDWAIKMAESLEVAYVDSATEFKAHWNLDDRHHQATFRMFHQLTNLSSEGLTNNWSLLDENSGTGLFGRATTTFDDAGVEYYQCVWYETKPLISLGEISLRGAIDYQNQP